MPALVPESRVGRTLAVAVAVLASWTLFGLLASAHVFLTRAPDPTASFGDLLAHVGAFYVVWAALTPGLYALVRWAERARGPRGWAAIAAGAPASALVHGALYLSAMRLAEGVARQGPALDAYRAYLLRHGGGDLATYAVLVGAYFLFAANRRARDREELGARLARAELEILRWQLQPHFLFNALNTVSTLVLKHDVDGAERALALIARYVRAALAHRADAVVTVAEELRLVDEYVEIEALRFGDALRVEGQASDEALARRLPSMLLQPLVENAIHHGLDAGGGTVRLTAAVDGGRLVVRVSDPGGTPAPNADASGNGFGLRYVRERLTHFYGDAARLSLDMSPEGATTTVEIPPEPAVRAR